MNFVHDTSHHSDRVFDEFDQLLTFVETIIGVWCEIVAVVVVVVVIARGVHG